MAETTIEWCRIPRPDGSLCPGYSFSPWWGCWRISPACRDCYADAWAKRIGVAGLWTKNGPRRFFGREHFEIPLLWNRRALAAGERHAVFCSSMADVGEARADLDPWRALLWDLIARTPGLLWLLLTKRPEDLVRLVPWIRWPENVWLGVTVETPAYLSRIEAALAADAPVHFVSYEPAIEPVDFSPFLGSRRGRVQWLIVGSESGARARPTPVSVARDAVAQARLAGAAPFVKQLDASLLGLGRRGQVAKDLDALPPDLRVREWPAAIWR